MEKNAALKNPSKIPYPDPEADDFQKIMVSFLSKDASLLEFFRRSYHQFFSEVANRQTDRKTGKSRVQHSLGGGNGKTDQYMKTFHSWIGYTYSNWRLIEVANRETDRQTNKRLVKYNLFGGGNQFYIPCH